MSCPQLTPLPPKLPGLKPGQLIYYEGWDFPEGPMIVPKEPVEPLTADNFYRDIKECASPTVLRE